MTQPIFLIGPRGCGKTTVGHALARARHFQFSDTDHRLQAHEQRTVAEIVQAEGWARFRELETLSLKAVTLPNTVIATGGGIVLREENMTALRRSGFVCFLDRGAAEIAEGLDISGRPLLREGREKIYRLARERDALYRKYADVVVSEKTPEAAAEAVLYALAAAEPEKGEM